MKQFLMLLLISACSLAGVSAYAQKQGQARIDSLLEDLPKQKEDTNKVKLLNNLSYWCNGPQEGIMYAGQALALSEKLEWPHGIAISHTRFGNNYYAAADYSNSLDHYLKALHIFEELKDKTGIALLLTDVGLVYRRQDNFKKALDYSFKSLKIYEEINNRNRAANAMINICFIYSDMGDYTHALDYGLRSLSIRVQEGNKDEIAEALQGVGQVYSLQKDYSQAFQYLFRSLKLLEEMDSKRGTANTLTNIAETYLATAMDSTYKIIPDSFIAADKKQNLARAIVYVNRSIAIDREFSHLDYLQKNYWILSEVHRLLGNYKEALLSKDQYILFRDSVFSQKNMEAITRYETRQTEDLKNKEIQIANLAAAKRRNESILLACGLLILAMVAVVIFRERRKSEKLLLNILPREVAEELKARGSAAAKHFDGVTVLFSDFVNFTTAAERMTPQELINELDACFKAFDEITGKYNIEKIKTIGDAYLAVAGLPLPNPMHAENVIKAALEISEFMQQRMATPGNKTFAIRIGVHSGSVVAGIVGAKKFAYDIWGDTVNTAARMEQNSLAGKINISQTTYELVKDKFACEYRGDIEAKNKGKMKMYFVTKR